MSNSVIAAPEACPPTFHAFTKNRYLPYTKPLKRSWHVDDGYLRHHILPAIGELPIHEIRRDAIGKLHHEMLAVGYAPATCNRVLMLVRRMFNQALEWEIPGLEKNPTKGLKLFLENNQRERYLTTEEAMRLVAAVKSNPNSQLQYIVPLLMLSGARKRELLDAKWADFDLSRKQWRIPKTKSGRHRYVPISEGFLAVLRSVPKIEGCPFLVPDPKTLKPFINIHYFWNKARVEAGLDDLRMHDLRHSFASFLVNSGRTIYEVQKILGHSQIKTTQRYAHLSQETLLQAANSVCSAMGLGGGSEAATNLGISIPSLLSKAS